MHAGGKVQVTVGARGGSSVALVPRERRGTSRQETAHKLKPS